MNNVRYEIKFYNKAAMFSKRMEMYILACPYPYIMFQSWTCETLPRISMTHHSLPKSNDTYLPDLWPYSGFLPVPPHHPPPRSTN